MNRSDLFVMSMVPKYLMGFNETLASVHASLAQLQVRADAVQLVACPTHSASIATVLQQRRPAHPPHGPFEQYVVVSSQRCCCCCCCMQAFVVPTTRPNGGG